MTLSLVAETDADIEQMRLVEDGHEYGESGHLTPDPQHPHRVAGGQGIGEVAARPRKHLQCGLKGRNCVEIISRQGEPHAHALPPASSRSRVVRATLSRM